MSDTRYSLIKNPKANRYSLISPASSDFTGVPQEPNIPPPDEPKGFNAHDLAILLSETVRGFVVGGVGVTTGVLTRNPLIGGTAAIGTDLAFQKAQEGVGLRSRSLIGSMMDYPQGSISDYLASTGEELSFGEMGGRAIEKVGGIAKSLWDKTGTAISEFRAGKPQSILTSPISEFAEHKGIPATASSQLGSTGLALIEQIGAPIKYPKVRSYANKITKLRVDDYVRNLLPTTTEELSPWLIADQFKQDLKQTYGFLAELGSDYAETVKRIAKNPNNTIGDVSGPVYQKRAAIWADATLKEVHSDYMSLNKTTLFSLATNEQKPRVTLANDILERARKVSDGSYLRDSAGNFVMEPVSFASAWEDQKKLGSYAARYHKEGIISSDSRYRDISQARKGLVDDIEESIVNWPARSTHVEPNGDVIDNALEGYRNAKKVTQTRFELLENGDNLETLLREDVAGAEELRKSLVNPVAAGKARAAGKGRTVAVFDFYDQVQAAWNPKKQTFDGAKLVNNWYKPEHRAVTKKLLQPNQLEVMDHWVNVIAKVSEDPGKAGLVAALLRITQSAVYVGGAALLGTATQGSKISAGVLGGYIGLNWFTRNVLLDDKKSKLLLNLLKTNPGSSTWKNMSRVLGNSLNGARIMLLNQDGSLHPGVIKDGRYELVDSFEEEPSQ